MNCYNFPQSPGYALFKWYVEPEGLSQNKLSIRLKTSLSTVSKIYKSGVLPTFLFARVSKLTGTTPGYWRYLQDNFELQLCFKRDQKTVMPIHTTIKQEHNLFDSKSEYLPGRILYDHIAKLGKGYLWYDDLFKIADYSVHDIIFNGKTITPSHAAKFSAFFGTTTKYWLDIQSCFDVSEKLGINNLVLTDSNIESYNPGKKFFETKIIGGGLSILHVSQMLGIGKKRLRTMLLGKIEIPIDILIKMSRLFGINLSDWINEQNSFQALTMDDRYKEERIRISLAAKKIRKESRNSEKDTNPINWLTYNFLKPMRISREEFVKHIGMTIAQFEQIQKGRQRLTPQYALRIGDALKMDPRFWMNLQLEYDLHRTLDK